MTAISYFKPANGRPGTKPDSDLSYESYFAYIRDGHWQDDVLNVRAGRREKASVPGVTPSGKFTYRNKDGLIEHSGVIALDFDAKDNEYFPADEIAADQYTFGMHRSISGAGWVVYVKISPDRHSDSFLALEKYFANQYQVVVDPSGKDVGRFRFVSYDPELYHNPGARIWKRYLPKKTIMPVNRVYIYTENDVEHCINQIRSKAINIADEYHDWIKIGMALAGAYGEQGRDYFHQISAISSKYDRDKCDKKYTNLIKTTGGRVGIASFFWICQQAGIEIKTKRTQHIERVAKMQRRVVGANGGHATKDAAADAAKRTLREMDGIDGDDMEKIVDQIMELSDDAIEAEKSEDLVADIKEFLRTYDMKFNEVTRVIEIDGEPITDRLFNSMYVKAMEVLGTNPAKGKALTKDLLFSIMDSDFTKSYHPMRDFFSEHSNMKPKGEIDKLLKSVKVSPMQYSETEAVDGAEYLAKYGRKWLLSCVASWHGTYSVMMLVLTGEQMTGKTNFFRWLLPEDLSLYYAESTLDAGKDDEILMCQKAIICDDEYEGKTKQDYKRLKAMLSKQTFSIRKPYGRITEDLERIAVLCGTSNEEEIINDPTGNRRIIPVPVETIDWEAYHRVDKTALWMELYNEWKRIGDGWMMSKKDVKMLNKMTLRNEQVSREEEAILMFFDLPDVGGYVDHMTNTEILNYIETNTKLKLSQTKLGLILKKLGFQKQMQKSNGIMRQVYPVIKKRQSGPAETTPF